MRWWCLPIVPLLLGAGRPVATSGSATVVKATTPEAPELGPRDATVTVEFFCTPLLQQCANVDDLLRALAERHPDRLRVVYRGVALAYKDSQLVAEAELEAFKQGRFMEFTEEAFAHRGGFTGKDVEPAARKVGMDLVALRAALNDHRHRGAVERDTLRREELGATTLPALVWNGAVLVPPLRLEDFETAWDRADKEASRLLHEGVSPSRLYARLLRDAARARFTARVADPRLQIDLGKRARIGVENAPTRGSDAPDVTVVIFSDFECPFCRRELEPLIKLEGMYPGRIRIAFKHFPQPYHPNARLAAEAAVCAHRQGRFWAMHDLLFQNPTRLKRVDLDRWALAAGIDVAQFDADLNAGRCAAAVDADVADARSLSVDVTPTVFVNGIRLPGLRSFSDLRVLIEDELSPGWLGALTDDVP